MDSIDESRRSRRTAQALERSLCSWHANRTSQRALPVDHWRHVEVLHRRVALARQHHLHAAEQHCQKQLREGIQQLSREMNDFSRQFPIRDHIATCPTLRVLHEELTSLSDEFVDVKFDLSQKVVTVRTQGQRSFWVVYGVWGGLHLV